MHHFFHSLVGWVRLIQPLGLPIGKLRVDNNVGALLGVEHVDPNLDEIQTRHLFISRVSVNGHC